MSNVLRDMWRACPRTVSEFFSKEKEFYAWLTFAVVVVIPLVAATIYYEVRHLDRQRAKIISENRAEIEKLEAATNNGVIYEVK